MSEIKQKGNEARRPLISGKGLKVMFALGFFSAIGAYFSPPPKPVPPVIPIKSEPYQWPSGCPEQDYQKYDEISSSCMVDRYLLPKELAKSHGLIVRKRRKTLIYYRINDDAAYIRCSSRRCRIKTIYFDVFNGGN